jgi:microcystin-dependent protein
MSSVKVNKNYVQFKDNSKMIGAFPSIGSIILWPGNVDNIPNGYLICNGTLLDKEETISQNSNEKKYDKLFEKIGYKYGNDSNDENKFKIPNMCERFPLGANRQEFINKSATNIMGGVKKLNNTHLRHTHGLSMNTFVKKFNTQNAWDSSGPNSYDASWHTTTNHYNYTATTGEHEDNEDYLTKFVATVYLIRYING